MLKFKIQPKTELNGTDVIFLIIITFLSFTSRFWVLHNPDAVVFDEVHFGNFTNWYTMSEFFYDIHPPLGKLVMFLFANLSEYDGSIQFSKYYAQSFHNTQYIILRITPAFFSSLCAPLIYLTLRFDSFSPYAAFISSFMIICDSSLLTEQRYILSDGMLHFFCCLFFCVFAYTNSLNPFTCRWIIFMILSGATLGCACSSKNTAWGLMVFCGFVQVFQAFQYFGLLDIRAYFSISVRGCLLLLPGLSVYFISFFIHFMILPFSGQGTPYLSPEMKNQLVNRNIVKSELWGRRLSEPSLFKRTILLSINMHHGNMGILNFHASQSRPINWPLLTGNYVAFYSSYGKEVNCMGNALVYYISFFSLIFNLITFMFEKWDIALRYIVGWAISYFPFFLIPRSMFLYHYLIPLMIGCISAGAAVDRIFPRVWVGIMLVVICLLCLFGFILWSPYSYGISHLDRKVTIWNDNWIYGDAYHRELRKKN